MTSNLPPDAAFDRQWALTVLARALHALRRECEAEGDAELFDQLQPWLTGEAAHGDQGALAESLGLNLNSLKSAVHRLKRRFRDIREGRGQRHARRRGFGGRRDERALRRLARALKNLCNPSPETRQESGMSESSPSFKQCPQCGATLPAGATNGLCPVCLMAEAMQSDPAGRRTSCADAHPHAGGTRAAFPAAWKSSNASAAAAWAWFTRRGRNRSTASSR